MKLKLSAWILVIIAGLVLSAVGLYAQSGTSTKYNIPFEFLVGKTVMPAGEYTIRPLSLASPEGPRVLQKTDGSKGIYVLSSAFDPNKDNKNCKLIFFQGEAGYRLFKIQERNGELALTYAEIKSGKNETGNLTVAKHELERIVVVNASLN
jgi:hypothetical protein